MGCSEPASQVDDGVDDRDDIETHVVVEDVEVVIGKRPRR